MVSSEYGMKIRLQISHSALYFWARETADDYCGNGAGHNVDTSDIILPR
jgi:hypothetical protein